MANATDGLTSEFNYQVHEKIKEHGFHLHLLANALTKAPLPRYAAFLTIKNFSCFWDFNRF